ncbi:TVP38/TMEM64 family protein [Pontibacter virosus]|uniref:TVP38/TMEM64 family membrane protein n=1 Tax=Pontibacter virosus TaxID=1765052 RepID=A0A2U1AXZ3_9BACT|nr:TVP38/TMEM64 family protein [Pontibacter virosus]PVY41290.1 putative membrane protein YdjX (TVP38/TMEM64 family) [Pontibacter virosus]
MSQNTATAQKDVKQSKWPLAVTAGIIALLVLSYFIFPDFQANIREGWDVLTSGEEERISKWVEQFGFWGPFFIILAMVAQMFLLVVNVVALMLVAIIAYGPIWGSLIAVAAVLVASTIGYLIGRGLGEAGVRKIIGQKAEDKVCGFVSDYGIWAVIIARISPFLSNDAVSFVAGLTKMGYIKFIGATLAGITPLTILLAWLGEDNDRLMNGLIWVGGVSLALFIGYVIYDKYFKNKHRQN